MPSKFDPKKHHRRSIRLPEYDYSQPGAYYVTIVASDRESLFGEVVNKETVLTKFGLVAKQQWEKLPKRFPMVGARRGIRTIMTINRPAVPLRGKDSKNL